MIDPIAVARRCASVLGAEPFTPEPGLSGEPIGGHWGGILLSDWDAAIHLILELVIDRPPKAGIWELELLTDQVMPILEAAGMLRATGAIPQRSCDADTMRVNSLALMVLFRRAATLERRYTALQGVAKACWDALVASCPAGPGSGGAVEMLDAVREELERTRPFRHRGKVPARPTRAQLGRLCQELRGFVLLAALPDTSEVAMPMARAKRALFEELTSRDASESEACDWPPFESFEDANILIRHLHFLASRALGAGNLGYDESLQLSEPVFNGLVPSGEGVKRLFHTLGTVAQLKDIAGAAGLVGIPRENLTSSKAESWATFLHDTRGPLDETRGLYCHLAIATGMAVTALNRYAAARPLAPARRNELRRSTKESVEWFRTLRLRDPRFRALAFCPYVLQNDVVLRCWLLCEQLREPQRLRSQNILDAVRYQLSCQAPNGLFHQRYRTNELDEGESTATSVCLCSLSGFARWLRKEAPAAWFDNEEARQSLQRELAYALQFSAEALLEIQNESGGFPTFARTEREKHGLLAAGEGPGAQAYLLYDAPGADIVGWCLEGLCELKSGAPEVPLMQLPRSLQQGIDRSVALAVDWLRRDFHPRAGWWARYGGGYIIGTALALRGLRLAGVPSNDPIVQRAAELFIQAQNSAGGWDQDVRADDPAFNSHPEKIAMRGKNRESSHPTLTAWAIMGLLDAGLSPRNPILQRGVEHLLELAGEGARGWQTETAVHSVMRGWYYVDPLQTRLRPAEALLRWASASQQKK
ncbi:MAG TPA: hypothetical protein VG963_03600 [Polyangiaceae bacterium]|nr:hypothetical protein [Polyangiaceae bacterium]